MPKGGALSRATLERIEAELAAEREERAEYERLYQEQQTANGNPQSPCQLPSIYEDDPYGKAQEPQEPYMIVLEWRARRELVDSREQWDVVRYLVKHGAFETREQMNEHFDKPKKSPWARSVLRLMVEQRVFSEIEIEFLVSKRNTVKITNTHTNKEHTP